MRISRRAGSHGQQAILAASLAAGLLSLSGSLACAQAPAGPYPERAPLDQYMMDRPTEIALAKSAAPGFVSDQASIYVLTQHGYELAVRGSNGFTCFVDRSWSKLFADPDFWNPHVAGPTCLNSPAAPVLTLTEKVTEWALAGHSKAQIEADTKAALEAKAFPAIAPGAMSYMMSKDQYLSSPATPGGATHWKPHVMFYFPGADPDLWGDANLNTVLVAVRMPQDFDVVMVPVSKWSDGAPAAPLPAGATHTH